MKGMTKVLKGEGSLKARKGHVHPEPSVAITSSIGPRLRDILARSSGTSGPAGVREA